MKIIKSSDWLIGENKNGGRKFWRLHILQDGVDYFTQTEWYQVTKTGRETKRQLSEPYHAAPTNEGRANARDSKAQSEFEFDAIKKQRDKGFGYDGEKRQMWPMPMLAHKFSDHKGKMDFPVFVQPKLNGMRMLFDGFEGWSRGNKQVIPEVIKHLNFDTAGFILDGELMLPGNQLLQESMKAIKKYRSELSPKLLYHVYDIVDSELPYIKRYQIIEDICRNAPENIKIVNTMQADDEAQVMAFHKQVVAEGFEGTMVRDPAALYEIGKRSYSLLKLKDFQDAEYRIVGVVDGDGSDSGLAIFELETPTGQKFNCRPEVRRRIVLNSYKNRKELVGRFLTVRFFELSKTVYPSSPVGVGIRDFKDFS